MVTVEADLDGVERRLAAGELWCPSCGAVLRGWGRARSRLVRGPDGPVQLCPRRSRCTGCGVTHVLLPVSALLRRADAAAVIVSALAAKARCGVGFRRIGSLLVGLASDPRANREGRCNVPRVDFVEPIDQWLSDSSEESGHHDCLRVDEGDRCVEASAEDAAG